MILKDGERFVLVKDNDGSDTVSVLKDGEDGVG